jgi:hypothetical protein
MSLRGQRIVLRQLPGRRAALGGCGRDVLSLYGTVDQVLNEVVLAGAVVLALLLVVPQGRWAREPMEVRR